MKKIPFGFVILSRSEGSLVHEAEILRCACGLAQDDNPLSFSTNVYYKRCSAYPVLKIAEPQCSL